MNDLLVTRSRLWLVAPTLLVIAPLTGFAFHLDERLLIWRAAIFERDFLFDSLDYAYLTIDNYLSAGNFRPLGRFVEGLVTGFAFEASEATRIAPHVVMGVFRLLAIAILACICAGIVSALARSSGLLPDSPAAVLYPLVFGSVLVANGRSGPLVHFSFVFIGAVSFIFLVALLSARDVDLQPRKLTWYEVAGMALLGAMAAMYYDLVYIAPPLAAAFIVARAVAARISLKHLIGWAAVRRWCALSIGFLLVFIPTRIEIATRCNRDPCYVGTDINLSLDIFEVLPVRAFSGAPPAGWSVVSGLVRTYGPEFGIRDLVSNSFLALLLAGIVALTILAAKATVSQAADTTTRASLPDSPLHGRISDRDTRFGVILCLLGLTTILLSSLLISLSTWIQTSRIDYGWRDSLLTQTGWSFTIIGALVLILGLFRSKGTRHFLAVGITICLGVGLILTLLANARLTQVDRHSPIASTTNLISAATVNIDATEMGNLVRCTLLDVYTALEPESPRLAGPKLRYDLDRLMMDRYGWPFCDPVD